MPDRHHPTHKRRHGKREFAPLPQATLTQAAQPQGEQPTATADSSITPERGVRPPFTAKAQPANPLSVYSYVGSEMRRIGAIMALVIIILVVLGLVLR
jgi:hypothetical protein